MVGLLPLGIRICVLAVTIQVTVYEANISPTRTTPSQIVDVGKTALDEQIFEEYLAEMRVRDHYTADEVHFLLSRFLLLGVHHFVRDSCSIISWAMAISVQMYGSSSLIIYVPAHFNCSSFTNDCEGEGFLTGGSMAWIKGAFLLPIFPVSSLNRHSYNQIFPLAPSRRLMARRNVLP